MDWSDGSGLVAVGDVVSGFDLSHTFAVGGTYFVSICVTDDDGGPGCDTVAVVVASDGNLPPDAVADTGTVRRNSTANALSVLSNDTDPDFDGLTISAFDAVSTAGGAVDCSSEFWCYYSAPVDFVGTDTFTYTASDGQGGVDTATVTVTVVLNQVPVAIDDTETVRRDSLPRDIYVLGNDSDADFDFLTISAFDPASVVGGTVSCGTFACTYTPPVGFVGTDTFTYTVSDGHSGTDTATVTVNVVPNTAPDAQDDSFAGNAPQAPFAIFVAGNDFDVDLDVLTITAVSDPPRGSVVIATDGSHVVYTPDAGVVGTDTFTYTISDGAGGTDTATVTVTVRDYADITNGVVRIGVWDRGNLNIPTGVGLTYVPTGNESTAPGCPCEGWGAADATTGATGYANESAGTAGIQTVSFVKTASSAVSTVLVGTTLRVTHDYHPSTNPNLYEVTVTVENVSAAPVDLRYRRVMDWDIEPTAFSEYVTIEARQRRRHPVHERRRLCHRRPARRAVVDPVHRRSGRQRSGGPRLAVRLRVRVARAGGDHNVPHLLRGGGQRGRCPGRARRCRRRGVFTRSAEHRRRPDPRHAEHLRVRVHGRRWRLRVPRRRPRRSVRRAGRQHGDARRNWVVGARRDDRLVFVDARRSADRRDDRDAVVRSDRRRDRSDHAHGV